LAALREDAADDGVVVDRLADTSLHPAIVDAPRDQGAVQDGTKGEGDDKGSVDELGHHAHSKRRRQLPLNETLVPRWGMLSAPYEG
jgi:hypothetical protein